MIFFEQFLFIPSRFQRHKVWNKWSLWKNCSVMYGRVSHNNALVNLRSKLIQDAGVQTTLDKNHLTWSSLFSGR